jgi:hypothetical protein
MIIDYKTKKITFGKHLPPSLPISSCPLRLHRLATVRGMVDGRTWRTSSSTRRGGDLDQPRYRHRHRAGMNRFARSR